MTESSLGNYQYGRESRILRKIAIGRPSFVGIFSGCFLGFGLGVFLSGVASALVGTYQSLHLEGFVLLAETVCVVLSLLVWMRIDLRYRDKRILMSYENRRAICFGILLGCSYYSVTGLFLIFFGFEPSYGEQIDRAETTVGIHLILGLFVM